MSIDLYMFFCQGVLYSLILVSLGLYIYMLREEMRDE